MGKFSGLNKCGAANPKTDRDPKERSHPITEYDWPRDPVMANCINPLVQTALRRPVLVLAGAAPRTLMRIE